jgi:hypothetical protein
MDGEELVDRALDSQAENRKGLDKAREHQWRDVSPGLLELTNAGFCRSSL